MAKQDERPAEEADASEAHEEAIRRRAYEISQSADTGTAEENWERAKRELETEN